jgi:hypothetical protein
MNNKLIARVVAGAMAVAMLGTVSFATAKVSGDKDTVTPGTITETGYADQTTKTFMAFATDNASNAAPDTANGDVIIALGQEGSVPSTITVDPKKIGDNTHVVAIYSGTDGIMARKIIDVSTATRTFELDTDIANTFSVYDESTNEELKRYTNVAYAEYSFPLNNSSVNRVGFNFTGTKNGAAATADVYLDITGESITGEGLVKYAAIVFGIPTDDLASMKAVPYANYADYVE